MKERHLGTYENSRLTADEVITRCKGFILIGLHPNHNTEYVCATAGLSKIEILGMLVEGHQLLNNIQITTMSPQQPPQPGPGEPGEFEIPC